MFDPCSIYFKNSTDLHDLDLCPFCPEKESSFSRANVNISIKFEFSMISFLELWIPTEA